MKQFRELYFRGSEGELNNFISEIGNYANGNWQLRSKTDDTEEYLIFDYNGEAVDRASVFIYLKNRVDKGELHVGNIIPHEKNSLTVEEYNDILMKFYEDVIESYKCSHSILNIIGPTSDEVDITNIITCKALDKLKAFCNMANKTTGSSHPCDKERWFDFVCQTVEDGTIISTDTLAEFLKDETYWGSRPDGFMGAIGKFAWDEEHAYKLANDYENLTSILQYYKETRE